MDEKLKLPNVKAAVERARKRVAKAKDQDKPSSSDSSEKARVFMAAGYAASNSSDYNLRDSFILDSGAIAHMCNTRKRFISFTPASEDDLLYAGNTIIPIEGFSSIDITI